MLRSIEHPMGLPNLRPSEREEVRKGNVHLERSVEACRRITAVGGGFSWEQPEPVDGKPSAFTSPPVVQLIKETGAKIARFDQCRFGAETTKPTAVLYSRGVFCILRERCNHPKRSWPLPDGSNHRGPHPRLWGLRTPDGQWATKKAAEYTSEFSAALAKCIAVIQPPTAEGLPTP